MKTCADCPWYHPGECETQSGDECGPRKAFRVVRDEFRRAKQAHGVALMILDELHREVESLKQELDRVKGILIEEQEYSMRLEKQYVYPEDKS